MEENSTTGLTYDEFSIMYHIVQAWNLYLKLENQHPDDTENFRNSIHELQKIMAVRHMRRNYSDFWHVPSL